jgi:hypothetical protein
MRNSPLRGFMKSPLTQKKDSPAKDWKELAGAASDVGSYALSKGKSLVSKVGSKALGGVGLMLDATVTSDTDQPGTGTHGGEKRNWGFKNPPPDEK